MSESQQQQENWERRVLEKLAMEAVAEQRRRRRWGIFFKLLGFAYVTALIYLSGDWGASADKVVDGKSHTAMVTIDGMIGVDAEASADNVMAALKAAFEDKSAKGVVLRINSPGGSPVQAGMINDEVRRLRAKRPDLPVYAVVEDVCASGGYYVAVAADKIFVDKASIVGSIGVLMNGFGFVEGMEKLGIERRLLTAGENKGFLDPFSPLQPAHVEQARVMLGDIHRQFIDVVRKGRGERLKETPDTFSGLVWSGERSVELGLADGFGTVESVARDVIQAEDVRDYTHKRSLAERFARSFGADMAQGAFGAVSRLQLR